MPADFADLAQDLIENNIDKAISKRRQTLSLPFSGFCLCCKEPVAERRFCDKDCRELYEARQKKRFLDGR